MNRELRYHRPVCVEPQLMVRFVVLRKHSAETAVECGTIVRLLPKRSSMLSIWASLKNGRCVKRRPPRLFSQYWVQERQVVYLKSWLANKNVKWIESHCKTIHNRPLPKLHNELQLNRERSWKQAIIHWDRPSNYRILPNVQIHMLKLFERPRMHSLKRVFKQMIQAHTPSFKKTWEILSPCKRVVNMTWVSSTKKIQVCVCCNPVILNISKEII